MELSKFIQNFQQIRNSVREWEGTVREIIIGSDRRLQKKGIKIVRTAQRAKELLDFLSTECTKSKTQEGFPSSIHEIPLTTER